jgi:predicted transcriptional regulator
MGKKWSDERKSKIRNNINAKRKLTEIDVRKIRDLYRSGDHTQIEIASMFNIGRTTVQGIVFYKSWKKVG